MSRLEVDGRHKTKKRLPSIRRSSAWGNIIEMSYKKQDAHNPRRIREHADHFEK
jgi:hypothetical protein